MILIKQCRSIQLGHLYEHMICDEIDHFFYTSEAAALADKISGLDISLDQETLIVAGTQIVAEKEQLFGGLGYEAIKKPLEELHRQPWHDIDDLELIDMKTFVGKLAHFFLPRASLFLHES